MVEEDSGEGGSCGELSYTWPQARPACGWRNGRRGQQKVYKRQEEPPTLLHKAATTGSLLVEFTTAEDTGRDFISICRSLYHHSVSSSSSAVILPLL